MSFEQLQRWISGICKMLGEIRPGTPLPPDTDTEDDVGFQLSRQRKKPTQQPSRSASFSTQEVDTDLTATIITATRFDVLSPSVSECICATNVDAALVQKWLNNRQYNKDACFKCFLKCMSNFLGFMDTAGVFSEDLIAAKLNVSIADVQNCTKTVGPLLDLCEKAYQYGSCLLPKIP
ncbi:hypothetical protein FQA39_LY17408 [Lamprigera yunnana]|nr:hypothetical protein FQA39_LY17408 [Lamprigera yunnana]